MTRPSDTTRTRPPYEVPSVRFRPSVSAQDCLPTSTVASFTRPYKAGSTSQRNGHFSGGPAPPVRLRQDHPTRRPGPVPWTTGKDVEQLRTRGSACGLRYPCDRSRSSTVRVFGVRSATTMRGTASTRAAASTFAKATVDGVAAALQVGHSLSTVEGPTSLEQRPRSRRVA